MNAYIASLMLLLLNAVGLSMPAALAADNQVESQQSDAADALGAAIVNGSDQCGALDQSRCKYSNNLVFAAATQSATAALPLFAACQNESYCVDAPHFWDVGDKLEHVEGAP